MKMISEKAFSLIRELERGSDALPTFNNMLVRQICDEINALYDRNMRDTRELPVDYNNTENATLNLAGSTLNQSAVTGTQLRSENQDANTTTISTSTTPHQNEPKFNISLLSFRHACLQRNLRCVLAYIYNRIGRVKALRWQFGPTLPPDIKSQLCDAEIQWFINYSKIMSNYMRSIGDGIGINLTDNLQPPKSLYIEVRCLTNYGKFELDDGEIIFLKQNSQHYLPRMQCEALIRQGILQHIV